MLWRGICKKYQSRDETFPEPNGEGNLVSRLVFFANTPCQLRQWPNFYTNIPIHFVVYLA